MKKWWIGTSFAIVTIAAMSCGGDDSALLEPTGSAGSSGSGGSGGSSKAGSGGSSSSGSAGTAGTGSGGSTGGSGGAAGTTGGSGGAAGTTGTGGAADGGGSGGAAGGKADAAAGSGGGTTDGGRSDAPAMIDAPPSDGATACPTVAPGDGDACTGDEICQYGGVACACVRAGGGGGQRREWQCRRVPDAARDPDCPVDRPDMGTPCPDAGPRTICQYGGSGGPGGSATCICNQLDRWFCLGN